AFAAGRIVITAGKGKGQSRVIAGNTGTALTIKGSWAVRPDATSTYYVVQEYEEDGTTPAALDSLAKLRGSYSTIFSDDGIEAIWRVRDTANSLTLRKQWVVLLAQGDID